MILVVDRSLVNSQKKKKKPINKMDILLNKVCENVLFLFLSTLHFKHIKKMKLSPSTSLLNFLGVAFIAFVHSTPSSVNDSLQQSN